MEVILGEDQLDQCDYDTHCTNLYGLLEKSEWDIAILRIQEFPAESQTWVKRNEPNGNGIRWRLLPIHAAIIFKAPNKLIHELLESYEEGAMSQDDQGMLPLHLLLRQPDYDKEKVELILKKYPNAVLITDKKGRKPKNMLEAYIKQTTNKKSRGMHIESTVEERNPASIAHDTHDGKIKVLRTKFQSSILEYLTVEDLHRETLVHLETEEFVISLLTQQKDYHLEEKNNLKENHSKELSDLNSNYSNELTELKVENQRNAATKADLEGELENIRKQCQQAKEQSDLYRAIVAGNKRMQAQSSKIIEAMSETQDQTLCHILSNHEKAEAAYTSRINLVRDLLCNEERDRSLENKSIEDLMELIETAKIKTKAIGKANTPPTPEKKIEDKTDEISEVTNVTK